MVAQIFALDLTEVGWWWWAIAAVIAGVLAHVAQGFFIVWMPPNYLVRGGDWIRYRHSRWGWAVIVAKNLLGGVIVLLGVLMLVLPGPGIVTTLVGVSLLDFPGKRGLQCWLIHRPGVLKTVNGLRQRFGKPPLVEEGAKSPKIAAR